MINYDYCTGRYWISTNLYDYCTGRYWISTNLDDCRETAVSSRAEAHASAVRQVYRDPSTFPLTPLGDKPKTTPSIEKESRWSIHPFEIPHLCT